MRHIFGTYHYAMYHHEGDTIVAVKGHYVNPLVDKENAVSFWNIFPKS